MKVDVLIIGGGPSGLTAADECLRHGRLPLVIEASLEWGGIARTVKWQGHRVDIGGHRFFTKDETVEKRWQEWLAADMIEVPRLSRIFYQGHFYSYPLKLVETLKNFGLVGSVRAMLSYLRARLVPVHPEVSFEDWVSNRFGWHLYRTFFKSYTEKVWGIPCTEIRADWAAQRIHGLSLGAAVLNSLSLKRNVRSLIKTFRYPRLGPGMMWERVARSVTSRGGQTWTQSEAIELHHAHGKVTEVLILKEGQTVGVEADEIVSTMPLGHLIRALRPQPPEEVLTASNNLKHRDFLIVTLAVRAQNLFPDNWLYIHDPQYKVGRVQNFRNWSVEMVGDPELSTLGMEYFCSRGDSLWEMTDEELIRLATEEMASLGLAAADAVKNGMVIRQLNAYPVYDSTYAENLAIVRRYLETLTNLATVGRSGMHRYNNQDHSMLSAMAAVQRMLGDPNADPWAVNTERSGHEEQVLKSSVNTIVGVSP